MPQPHRLGFLGLDTINFSENFINLQAGALDRVKAAVYYVHMHIIDYLHTMLLTITL